MSHGDKSLVMPDAQIAYIAKRVGWTGGDAAIAVAIALAESGGKVQAHNDRPPDDSWGLWQINMYGDLEADRLKRYSLPHKRSLWNAATNGRVAYAIYQDAGNSFSPWSTYLSQSYRLYMPRAAKAVANPEEPRIDLFEIPEDPYVSPENPLDSLRNAIAGIQALVEFVTDTDNWRRVAMFVGGGALIIVAAVAAFGDELASAIPYGKVAGKVAKRL